MKVGRVLTAAIALGALAGCSSGGSSPTTTRSTAPGPCTAASNALKASLVSGLRSDAEVTVAKVATVKAGDRDLTFFVAADLTVAGKPETALWVTTAANGTGALFSLDAAALKYSSWNDGARAQAKYSATEPAAKAALACL